MTTVNPRDPKYRLDRAWETTENLMDQVSDELANSTNLIQHDRLMERNNDLFNDLDQIAVHMRNT